MQIQKGESVLLKVDVRIFTELIPPLFTQIRRAGAFVLGTIISEKTENTSDNELDSIRKLFNDADIFIWLPEVHQGCTPAVRQALDEWLDNKRGRSVHFHWASGTYQLPGSPLPKPEKINHDYLKALDVVPSSLQVTQDVAIRILRSGPVLIKTPEGTNLSFVIGNRRFSSQTGDASLDAAKDWKLRIDRDVELPSGILRVAPNETSANGTLVLPSWHHLGIDSNELILEFIDGQVVDIRGKNAHEINRALTAAGGAARIFREFGLGCNPALRINPNQPYIGYYGYGAGIVRLSLGDNLEMGGNNRGGGVYWNFLTNATVKVGPTTLVEKGELML